MQAKPSTHVTKPGTVPFGRMVIELGIIAASRKAIAQLEKSDAMDGLTRHLIGDWGDISQEAWQANEEALAGGRSVVSSYLDRHLQRGRRVPGRIRHALGSEPDARRAVWNAMGHDSLQELRRGKSLQP